jgi:nitrogen fixation protein NifU and related proteins
VSVQDLYQQVILEHNKKPRNFGKLDSATHAAEGFNPVCGDHLWVYLQVNDAGVIEAAAFEGSGCAISKASASMMTVSLKGKTVEEAEVIFNGMHDMLTGSLKEGPRIEALGKLKIFAGIWQYPARVKCAALSWHTMNGAVKSEKIVSTE